MDVSNLIPTPAGTGATGAAATRAKTDRATFEALPPAPAAVAGAPATPRPVLGASDVFDRVERSPELERTVVELKLDLSRLSDPPAARIDLLRSELADPASASRESLEAAATGILRGDPHFEA